MPKGDNPKALLSRELKDKGLKSCHKCHEIKAHSDFYKDSGMWDGYNGLCKSCSADKQKKRRAEIYSDPKAKKLYQKRCKKWASNNRDRKLLYNSKKRAKEMGIEHSISIEDIVIPEFCPVLGIKLEFSSRSFSDNGPSIDRVDNTKGYTKDNICIISWRANSIKSDATLEELEKLVKWLKHQSMKGAKDVNNQGEEADRN